MPVFFFSYVMDPSHIFQEIGTVMIQPSEGGAITQENFYQNVKGERNYVWWDHIFVNFFQPFTFSDNQKNTLKDIGNPKSITWPP